MIRSPRLPDERRADDILDDYLSDRFGVGLEQVLLDGIQGHLTAPVVGAVEFDVQSATRWPHSDGGVSEDFSGVLTVEGVAYRFRCEAYSVPIAYVHRFLTNLWEFEAVEWNVQAPLDRHG